MFSQDIPATPQNLLDLPSSFLLILPPSLSLSSLLKSVLGGNYYLYSVVVVLSFLSTIQGLILLHIRLDLASCGEEKRKKPKRIMADSQSSLSDKVLTTPSEEMSPMQSASLLPLLSYRVDNRESQKHTE